MFFKKTPGFDKSNLKSVIKACQKGDGQAQKALIKLFYSYAKGISMRYAYNEQEGEEIMNDGFLKVFANLYKFNDAHDFKAWLRTILVNTANDFYRKNRKYEGTEDVEDLEVADVDDDVISKISAEEILALVQKLPPSYRMVFMLYVVEGYNHREIAEMLNIKEGTSKSNLQDARRKLQAMIKSPYPNIRMEYRVKLNKHNEN